MELTHKWNFFAVMIANMDAIVLGTVLAIFVSVNELFDGNFNDGFGSASINGHFNTTIFHTLGFTIPFVIVVITRFMSGLSRIKKSEPVIVISGIGRSADSCL